jgi:hypothetical protein
MSDMVLKSKNTGFEVLKLRDDDDDDDDDDEDDIDDDDATAAERQALRRDAEVIALHVKEFADTLYFLLLTRAALRLTVIKLCICDERLLRGNELELPRDQNPELKCAGRGVSRGA